MSKNFTDVDNKLKDKSNRRDHSMMNNNYNNYQGSGRHIYAPAKGVEASQEDPLASARDSAEPVQDSPADCMGSSTAQFIFRITLVLVVGIALAAASLAPGILPNEDIACIKDQFFIQTEGINEYFIAHPHLQDAFMILCGLCMDVTMVVGLVVFAVHGKTWRLPMTLGMFYVLRFLIQKTFLMRFPEGYLWRYPGFPSLVVPYGATNDFFYSGHVGGALVMTLEYRTLAKELTKHKMFMRSMQLFGFLTVIFQIFLMIFLRGHYSIDMITGLIVGHYLYIIASLWAPNVDSFLCRIKKSPESHKLIDRTRGDSETWGSGLLQKSPARSN